MSCLAAVVCEDGSSERIRKMLCAMVTRGIKAYGIATPEEIETPLKLGDHFSAKDSTIAIGHGIGEDALESAAQPLRKLGTNVSIAGRVFPRPAPDDAQNLLKWMTEIEEPADFIKCNVGAYAFAVLRDKHLSIGRDSSGGAPLYVGQVRDGVAFATERKALWAIGATTTRPFAPGSVTTFFDRKTKTTKVPIPCAKLPKGEEIPQLLEALRKAVGRRLSDVNRVALAFSGGVDSSIVAKLAVESVKVELVHVVFGGESKELAQARQAARALGLDLWEDSVSPEECEDAIPDVLWAIETHDAQALEIALAIHFVAKGVRDMGCRVVMMGQGADELFAGYSRYQRTYSSRGEPAVLDEMSRDIAEMHEKNLARDEKVCARSGVEIRSPFWDVQVISLANSIPIDLKLSDPQDPLRKKILRDLASRLGLPETISKSPKKAIQYGSGSHRLLKEIALRSGKSLTEYAESRFEEVKKKELSSPIC